MDTLEKLQPEIAENSWNQFSAWAEVSSILSSLHLSSWESITFIEKDRYGIPVASIEIRSIIEKKIKKIDGTIVWVEQKTIWFCDKLKRLRWGNPLSIKWMIEKVIQSAKIQWVHTLRLNALSQPRRTIDYWWEKDTYSRKTGTIL